MKKLQEVRSSGEICDVNIILTNPDLLHLCGDDADVESRNQESSPERTSYRYWILVIVRMRDVLASQAVAGRGPMLSIYNFLLISDTK